MKKLNLRLFVLVALFSSFFGISKAQQVLPISLVPESWIHNEYLSVYNESGNLVFKVLSNANPIYQGTIIFLPNINTNLYKNLRLKTVGSDGVIWNAKIKDYNSTNEQVSLLPNGNDVNTFGTLDIQLPATLLSESINLELWFWVVGLDQKLVIEQLALYSDVNTSISNKTDNPMFITNKEGGIMLNNFAGKDILIYTMEGKLTQKIVAIDNNRLGIDLKSGIYLVKSGDQTFKVSVF